MKLLSTIVFVVGMCASVDAFAKTVTVGFISSLSGPISSLGIPYANGAIAGHKAIAKSADADIKLIRLDDASDPATAARNARKLINEDQVDVLMGTSGVPGTMAIAAVANESKVPFIAISPVANVSPATAQWMVSVAQPTELMINAVVEHMKAHGVKTVSYIGFSDAWGDLAYDALKKHAVQVGIELLNDERYSRTDASVTGQILKIRAKKPDAILAGTSGTPAALPYLELKKLGYKGKVYGTHGLINSDFIRVVGKAGDDILAPTGPVTVAEQLPDTNPVKKVALAYREAFQAAFPKGSPDVFSAWSYDAWLLLVAATAEAQKHAEPGTPAYRQAVMDAIFKTHELAGTHGVYNYKRGSPFGTDERARVVVRLQGGKWKLENE